MTADTHADCPGHAAYAKPSWGEHKAVPAYVCVYPRIHGHTDLGSRTPNTGGR